MRNKVLLAGAFLLGASSAFGFTMKGLQGMQSDSTEERYFPAACTNYSGEWSGTCELRVNGQNTSYSSDILIAQKGCHSVTVGDETLRFGTTYQSSEQFNGDEKTGRVSSHPTQLESKVVKWNDGSSEILFAGSITKFPTDENGKLIVDKYAGGLQLKNVDQLKSYMTVGERYFVICNYEKK